MELSRGRGCCLEEFSSFSPQPPLPGGSGPRTRCASPSSLFFEWGWMNPRSSGSGWRPNRSWRRSPHSRNWRWILTLYSLRSGPGSRTRWRNCLDKDDRRRKQNFSVKRLATVSCQSGNRSLWQYIRLDLRIQPLLISRSSFQRFRMAYLDGISIFVDDEGRGRSCRSSRIQSSPSKRGESPWQVDWWPRCNGWQSRATHSWLIALHHPRDRQNPWLLLISPTFLFVFAPVLVSELVQKFLISGSGLLKC